MQVISLGSLKRHSCFFGMLCFVFVFLHLLPLWFLKLRLWNCVFVVLIPKWKQAQYILEIGYTKCENKVNKTIKQKMILKQGWVSGKANNTRENLTGSKYSLSALNTLSKEAPMWWLQCTFRKEINT